MSAARERRREEKTTAAGEIPPAVMEREALNLRDLWLRRGSTDTALTAPQRLHGLPHGGAGMITIERYRRTRFWAVYEDGKLLCVTVYKKGANTVKTRFQLRRVRIASRRTKSPDSGV